ncbi:IS66 family transposase [Lacticaseibacillus paracasei]|uniref:IS66 family transposase n=1 Tax=Lacticaseibacillus paracasei TaxID=1597 RepID=UPI000F0B19EA
MKSILSDFFTWCESVHALSQSKLGCVIGYALSQRESVGMCCWMAVWIFQINRVERAVKEFVIGRKNGYFPRVSRRPDQAVLS